MSFFGFKSSKKAFREAIETDFENNITNFMDKNDTTRYQAYTHFENLFNENRAYDSLSDIFDGLSKGLCHAPSGQSVWESDKKMINKEMFAHMFETYMGGSDERRNIWEEMMPLSTAIFREMIQKEIK